MEDQKELSVLLNAIKSCEVSALNKNFDEFEYKNHCNRENILESSVNNLRDQLYHCNITQKSLSALLSDFYLLYTELKTIGPWNTDKAKELAEYLQRDFKQIFNIDIESLLCKDSVCEKQLIFDDCMDKIHRKLSQETFKKYPSVIKVYCTITSNLKDYDIKINPMKILPASLILIQDYIAENKVKGLMSCKNIFQCLALKDFGNGNYYEVFCETLFRQLTTKDEKLTNLILECTLEIIRILPEDKKEKTSDEFLVHILNEIYTTSEFKSKKVLFSSLVKFISNLQINSARRKKKLFMVIQENLDLCVNISVRNTIFVEVLDTLTTWLKYCWPLWKYSKDKPILSKLFKLLYVVSDSEIESISKINNLIHLLYILSLPDEQELILKSLDLISNKIVDKRYLNRLNNVKQLCVENKDNY